jgi:hypothetical protein
MYVRVCLTEEDRLRIAVGSAGEKPPAQLPNLLPQRRPLVHQTYELRVHLAQEPVDRFLLVTAPPEPRHRKRRGSHILGSQPVLLVEPCCSQGSLHPLVLCPLLLHAVLLVEPCCSQDSLQPKSSICI